MPSEVSIAGAHHDCDSMVEALKQELAQSREQQAATAEILAAISGSPTDAQRAFAKIATSAARLCDAYDAGIFRVEGGSLRTVAHHGPISMPDTLPLTREVSPGRAVLDRRTIHVADLQAEADEFPDGSVRARHLGFRTILNVPLMRGDDATGVISIRRTEVRPFTDRQVNLLKIFADQAVIAIENTRLFKEVQARNCDLTEALEQQTATSEILRTIASSPSDLTAILDAVAKNAGRLCDAEDIGVYQLDGNVLRAGGRYGAGPKQDIGSIAKIRSDLILGRTFLERRTIHVHDMAAELDGEYPGMRGTIERFGMRTMLATPLLSSGEAIGAIIAVRYKVQPFTNHQIDLVKTFADQAVIAIENTRLFEAEQTRTLELKESLEYQTAISDVLFVISRSPNDVQPVLHTIAQIAQRLCQAENAFVLQREGGGLRLVAASDAAPAWVSALKESLLPLDRGSLTGRVAIERRTLHIDDIRADSEYTLRPTLEHGERTQLGVPLLRDGEVIGVIIVGRTEVHPFTERQTGLIETFARQAVIAIENARLFEAEQARTRELQAAFDRQSATAEVLGAISRSPSEIKPVFDVIVSTAARLCRAEHAIIFRRESDDRFHVAATNNAEAEWFRWVTDNPLPPGRGSVAGRVAMEGKVVHVPDCLADPEFTLLDHQRVGKFRTMLGVPLLRERVCVGVIGLLRNVVQPFSAVEIDLVTTFADQAVIAIENTRLFEEVQTRNRALADANKQLTEALEQQTATSELLKVIGRSTFDSQPVFESLAENAVRLCEAERSIIYRFDGQFLRAVAIHNATPELRAFVEQNPVAPGKSGAAARAVVERRTVQILDVQTDPEYSYGVRHVDPVRTVIAVPILKGDELLGLILIYRLEVRAFTESQVALLETFADQAGIAIENARLFEEVQARNRDLTALGQVGRAVSSTLDLKLVLKTIVDRAVELSGTDGGSIFYYRKETGRFQLGETTGLDAQVVGRIRNLDIAAGQTGLDEAIVNRRPLQLTDLTKRASNPLRDVALEAGLHAALIVPLLGSEGALGALVLQRRRTGDFPPSVVSLMQSFADQSAIALENARLFDEIAQKSRELEIASQHKSQFVANMSHELRTPLAAMLGYAELIQEGFYEAQGPKSLDALTRIRSNGKHLLGLINTVLDIAKIESGQFTLNMAEYNIESVVETVRSATESLAQNKRLALKTEVADSLPTGLGDEQRLTQVLLNLVGNAIKFTDTGKVCVSAKVVNGHFNISVTDTGPGIPVEHQARVFDQFHQVDSSNTKAKGGTGLGLAIAKQIVEMHGGRIWVESTVGKGSIFQMDLPTRAAIR